VEGSGHAHSVIPAVDLPGGTDENYEKIGVPAEIQTRNLSNTEQKCRSPSMVDLVWNIIFCCCYAQHLEIISDIRACLFT
jgi:hypothetical protein